MKQIDDEGFERILDISPAYDMRNPDPKKNYGVHGLEMRFVLKGPLGAVQFVLFTNWMLPKVQEEFDKDDNLPRSLMRPMPADLGYHSPVPHYEDQDPHGGGCPYLDGRPCYYDGSGLQAQEPWNILVSEGEEALWAFLKRYYRFRLVDNDYAEPNPIEQPRDHA